VALSKELNLLTAKELGTLAKELSVFSWHTMRKEELINALTLKARTKLGRELIPKRLAKANKTATFKSKISSHSHKKKIEEKKKFKVKKKIVVIEELKNRKTKEKKKPEEKRKSEEKKSFSPHRKISSNKHTTRTTENKTTENKTVENKTPENKTVENKTPENKAAENKTVENKTVENKTVENKTAENKTAENKTVENKTAAENKVAENKNTENKKAEGKKSESKKTENKKTDPKKEVPRKPTTVLVAVEPKKESLSSQFRKKKLRRDISTHADENRADRLVLLVRDSFWLHAYWEITARTVERAKVALGMFWHTALPIIRLFRLESDGTGQPKRNIIRDILIHGGVNNWYLNVVDPPSAFQIEVGYLTREKKFYSLVSSNSVETPQQQVIDELDNLDGNWRGVAEDLGRIYKLSGGDSNNQELRKVFEEQLHRPMSAPLLSRYRAVQHQNLISEKTRRNFLFNIDVDIIVHGKTDPSVQVTIRNEPIKVQPDGSFSIRFALPEKRHVFPLEAEGSDGVETQRAILTIERNTRILETLFQEPADDD
jgi:hypothetical protein